MKFNSIVTVLLFLFSLSIQAQDWQTDVTKAKAIATTNNQNIVLVFQGSDWCAPCIKLNKEIWSTPKFQELANDHFVMLQADFPKRKANRLPSELQAHNNKLAEKYNPNGYFPYVVVMDANGKMLGSMGYEKTTPDVYYKKLTAFEK
ncbi:thioredoxin family protein [Lacinutrix neustonica]|uniref:Thioredoxin family protein n=1 Tax=Lacinutrix neustonica TaxID=2980107 RepID=A0A9E8MY03_9FLAO|nr:thioredoxin family protein [Lacinutrix neustonica]WAC02340.1 thioredoxin family protein [Lacinutrix neustonica]